MPLEVEVKYAVADFAAVRRALRAAKAEYLGTVLLTDRYFDTPDGALRRADRGLRIRAVRWLKSPHGRAEKRSLLTLKGPRLPRAGVKARRETQTRVDDPEAIAEVLAACGLEVRLEVQKRRASYRLGPCRVELDELPLIGRFVEIEGAGGAQVRAAARRLPVAGEPITAPYLALLDAACRKRGISRRRLRL